MNLSSNQRAFLKSLPLRRMSGQEKLLALVVHTLNGKVEQPIKLSDVLPGWRKAALGSKYSSMFFLRAQEKDWLNPAGHGVCALTSKGLAHLQSLLGAPEAAQTKFHQSAGRLSIIERKGTFTADKLLTQRFTSAKKEILVADSYVSRDTLQVILDGTSDSVIIKVLYGNEAPEFVAAAAKWRSEFSKLEILRYKHLHDRFSIIDGKGFILGPSIKDAAMNHPALLVELAGEESNLLLNFFKGLWKLGKSAP